MIKIYCTGATLGADTLVDFALNRDTVRVDNVANADLVVFPGGADISPELYRQKQILGTHTSTYQDAEEVNAWKVARETGKKMIGICRGAQFISAMLGGKLWQDIEGHPSPHRVLGEPEMQVNSYHHQGIRVHDGIRVIHTSVGEVTGEDDKGFGKEKIVETFAAPNIFAVQWHPEFISPHTKEPCLIWWIETFRQFMKTGEVK